MPKPSPDITVIIDRKLFFQIGRALQRGIGRSQLGKVMLTVTPGHLVIDSDWGGGAIPCRGDGTVSAQVSATAFCRLITTRFREKAPEGEMEVAFRPSMGEVAIDRAGVKAKF